MRRFMWLMLISVLVVVLTIIGCGSQTPKSTETKSTNQETVQTQSSTSTPSTKQDSAQTQSNSSTPAASPDTTQTQSNASTQSANKENTQAQAQGNTNIKTTNQGTTTQSQTNANPQPTNQNTTQAQNNAPAPTVKSNPIVTITMASGDQIKLELYPDVAPNTVKSFISLVNKGFYNGLIFHRVIPGFMIQGGDPNGNGTGGPGYSIKGEFTNNGFVNNLKHERGVLSMGRTSDPNSAGSQFFIMVANVSSLDKQYAAFGKVISGMDAVDKIVNSPRDKADKPLQSQVMKSVAVDTLGVTFGEPEVIKK